MDVPIREQIIERIRSNHTASVAELAEMLALTKADIRYHLKTLIADHLIEVTPVGEKPPRHGRGRPAARFMLTGKARPDNYQALAAILMRLFLDRSDQSPQENALTLASLMFDRTTANSSRPVQELNRLMDELNRRSYAAHWEARREGPEIFFENCPYAAILPDFPLLCEMDRQVITQHSGMSAVQIQRIDLSQRKPPACQFRLINK
jgi:predicted ArsR family transcriptional regulator